jgi:hypothetical protein
MEIGYLALGAGIFALGIAETRRLRSRASKPGPMERQFGRVLLMVGFAFVVTEIMRVLQ